MNPALAKIMADMQRQRDLFNLERDKLGDDLCKAATDGVQATLAAEQTPEGNPWDDLSPGYEKWKAKTHPGQKMAVLHKTLADPLEVAGEKDITPTKATVTYGISDQARQEAAWFSEGDPARGRPPRPFWGLTESSVRAIQQILDDRFATIR